MLGRKLLKRLTRLGLATYALTYCMAFTVCAAENPVADMAVAGTAELAVVESGIEGIDEGRINTDADISDVVTGDIGDDGVVDLADDDLSVSGDAVPGTISGNEADEIEENGDSSVPDSGYSIEFLNDEITILPNNPEAYVYTRICDPDGVYTYYVDEVSFTLYKDEDLQEEIEGQEDDGSVFYDDINIRLYKKSSFTYVYIDASSVTGPETFYIKAEYKYGENEADVVSDVRKVNIRWYDYESVDGLRIADINGYGSSVPAGKCPEFNITSVIPEDSLLDPGRISWGLIPGDADYKDTESTDSLSGATIVPSDDKKTASLNTAGAAGADVKVVLKYYYEDPNDTSIEDPRYVCTTSPRIKVINPFEDLEGHIVQKSAGIQIFRKDNYIPVYLRYKNGDAAVKPELIDPDISFTNTELADKFDVSFDGSKISVAAKSGTVNDAKAVSKFVKNKKGIKTAFKLEGIIQADGTDRRVNLTTEPVTLTFGNKLPSIKAASTYTFNSYYAESESEKFNITLNGIDYCKVESAGTLPKGIGLGYYGDYLPYLYSTNDIPGTVKKGSFSLKVTPVNHFPLNLPDNYSVNVPVSYKVVNNSPTVSPAKKSVIINSMTCDSEDIYLNIAGKDISSDNTEIIASLLDPKGKKLDASALDVTTSGLNCVYIKAGSATGFGKTYKVELRAKNTSNERLSAPAVITVTTPKKKDAQKSGITVKAKGVVNVSNPESKLTVIMTGKNVNLAGKTAEFAITVNGEDVRSLFDVYVNSGSQYVITMCPTDPDAVKALIDKGAVGKNLKIDVAFSYGEGQSLKGSYSTKIVQSAVKPKFSKKSIVLNPDYETAFNMTVTNLPDDLYEYDYKVVCGKDITSQFGCSADSSWNAAADRDCDYVKIKATSPTYLKELSGKTVTVSVTPKKFRGSDVEVKGQTASFKVKILDTKKGKNKISVKAKVKGNSKINPLLGSDDEVTAVISVKNANSINKLEVTKITRKVKKNTIDCTDQFYKYKNENMISVYYDQYSTPLAAGTYKATVAAVYKDSNGNDKPYYATFSFKVVRPKKAGSLNVKSVGFVNRDYEKAANLRISVKNEDYDIDRAELTGAYAEKFVLEKIRYGEYELRLKPGYIAKDKKGRTITKKLVFKKVPINVYYSGSPVPDKYNIKVTINP